MRFVLELCFICPVWCISSLCATLCCPPTPTPTPYSPALQTGIPVLGVVENMSGLHAPLPSFHFFGPGGEDVTAAVLAAVQGVVPGGVEGVTAMTQVFHASGGWRSCACWQLLSLLHRQRARCSA